jgi:hypothetical protein
MRKRSTILTTNLDYPARYDLFQRKNLGDALPDRLNHYCVTTRINGPSLRVSTHGKGKADTNPELPRRFLLFFEASPSLRIQLPSELLLSEPPTYQLRIQIVITCEREGINPGGQ